MRTGSTSRLALPEARLAATEQKMTGFGDHCLMDGREFSVRKEWRESNRTLLLAESEVGRRVPTLELAGMLSPTMGVPMNSRLSLLPNQFILSAGEELGKWGISAPL